MEMKFQFCDVFGLDPDLLGMVPQPCIALLLLFPINDKVKPSSLIITTWQILDLGRPGGQLGPFSMAKMYRSCLCHLITKQASVFLMDAVL
jgi:hypothetical protein